MNKFKVCVYAICKNDAVFVKRWIKSMSEADEIIVLDTGSVDGTDEALKKGGAAVFHKVISPWRCDIARNTSLKFVPEDTDICVYTDLDEVFVKGWRKKIENIWGNDVNMLRCRYHSEFITDCSGQNMFGMDKIHARQGFRWINPVHTSLQYTGSGKVICKNAEGILLDRQSISYPAPKPTQTTA